MYLPPDAEDQLFDTIRRRGLDDRDLPPGIILTLATK